MGAIVSTAEDAEVSYDQMDGVAGEVSVIAGGDFTRGSMNSEHRELRMAVRVTAANAESCRVTHCWTLPIDVSRSVTRSSRLIGSTYEFELLR